MKNRLPDDATIAWELPVCIQFGSELALCQGAVAGRLHPVSVPNASEGDIFFPNSRNFFDGFIVCDSAIGSRGKKRVAIHGFLGGNMRWLGVGRISSNDCACVFYTAYGIMVRAFRGLLTGDGYMQQPSEDLPEALFIPVCPIIATLGRLFQSSPSATPYCVGACPEAP